MPRSFAADVWVDRSDRLRQYRRRLTDRGVTMELRLAFSAFDVPVRIVARPPEQMSPS